MSILQDAQAAWGPVATLTAAWLAYRGQGRKTDSDLAGQYMARLAQVEERVAKLDALLAEEREQKLGVISERDHYRLQADGLREKVASLELRIGEMEREMDGLREERRERVGGR